MGSSHDKQIAVIDVGSAKTSVVVGEVGEGVLRYRGHATVESRGTRKGAIVDLDKTAGAITKAAEEAEKVCGGPIGHAVVSVGGPLMRGINSRGGMNLGSRPREITP